MGFSKAILQSLCLVGEFTLFVFETLRSFKGIFRRRILFYRQCEFIGVSSMGIIAVAAIFMGAVLGYQLYVSLHWFGVDAILGGTVGVALFRELGPVLAAIMVTGRAGAAMAAEISSMRITEQIDALEIMAVDPFEYLVAPRVLAGFVMLPFVALFFGGIATLAAQGVACGIMDLDPSVYWGQFTKYVDLLEIGHTLIKSATFGLVITWIGCFCGYRAHGGAHAVGLATRSTVVASCLVILLSDYVLTSLLPFTLSELIAM